MKKRLLSLVAIFALVVCMVVPTMAADGLNDDEAGVLAKFTTAVDSKRDIIDNLADQYIGEARNTLTNKVELDAAACADLSATIDVAMAKIEGLTTKQAIKDSGVLELVNGAIAKYNMSISISADGEATVTVKGQPVASTRPAVNQTGVDMTATYVVIAAVVAALVAGLIVINRKKATVR